MKYLVLLGLVEILISTVNIGFTSFEDIYNDGHRHLPKDQIHMKIVEDTEVSYDYKVDEDSFDKIHPPIRFDEERFSASSGQLVGSIGLGSATIISIEENEEKELRSEILTAAHMVKKNQIVDFPIIYQGRTSFENGNIAYLAKHEVDEVCFNPNSDKDIALLKAEITENNIGDELFDKSANIVLQSFFSNPFKTMRGYMSHYPFGSPTQRFNHGKINIKGRQTISSLPGSSGAGIFNTEGDLAWVHSKPYNHTSTKVLYEIESLGLMSRIDFISAYNQASRITQEKLEEFCDCYKRRQ